MTQHPPSFEIRTIAMTTIIRYNYYNTFHIQSNHTAAEQTKRFHTFFHSRRYLVLKKKQKTPVSPLAIHC